MDHQKPEREIAARYRLREMWLGEDDQFGSNRYTFMMSAQCPLVFQLRKYRCTAANVEMGQQETSRNGLHRVPISLHGWWKAD